MDIKTNKLMTCENKKSIQIPSLHLIVSNNSDIHSQENFKQLSTRLFKDKKSSFHIHPQYTFSFSSKQE